MFYIYKQSGKLYIYIYNFIYVLLPQFSVMYQFVLCIKDLGHMFGIYVRHNWSNIHNIVFENN